MIRSRAFELFLMVAAVCLTLLVADAVLGGLGFPDEINDAPVSYPPNFTMRMKFLDFHYQYQANSRGIRYREIADEKSSSEESRTLVIGDSFVEGQGVEADQTFTAILEKRFSTPDKPTLWINAGVSGSNPYYYSEMLYRIGLKYQPDRVLLVLYANDLIDLDPDSQTQAHWTSDVFLDHLAQNPPRQGLKRWAHDLCPRLYTLARRAFYRLPGLRRPERLIHDTEESARGQGISQEAIDGWKADLTPEVIGLVDGGGLQANIYNMGLLDPDYWRNALDLNGADAEKQWVVMRGYLLKMTEVCRSRGIEMAWVYAPHPYQYDEKFSPLPEKLGVHVRREWLTETTELERRLETLAHENKINFLDLTSAFRAATSAERPLNFRLDMHWNEDGHRVAADAIESWLRA